MAATTTILLLEFEQPDPSVWEAILDFVEQWNDRRATKFSRAEASEVVIHFSTQQAQSEQQELEALLTQKQQEQGWEWIKTQPNDPTKTQLESYDFIQIIGDGYPDDFWLNESSALAASDTCAQCGTQHPHLQKQTQQLRINEDWLTKPIDPNTRHTPLGLDLINMPHGALLVSSKLQKLLIRHPSWQGYTLLEVINQDGQVSERVFQLKAEVVVLLPDQSSDSGAICPACGTVLGRFSEPFSVAAHRLSGSSFFSRHPDGVSAIYIQQSLYRAFQAENIRGLTPVQGAVLVH